MFGMEILKQGVRWGIGNVLRTRVLTDNCIPGVAPDRIETLIPMPSQATVSSLIDENTGAWHTDVVRGFFDESIASKILQIPLSRNRDDDFPSWPHAKYGTFTVRDLHII
jgi:hypothetical protein